MKGVAVSLLVVISMGLLPCLGTPQGTNSSSQNSSENSSGKHTPSANADKNPLPEGTSPTNNAVETQRQVLEAILNQILQQQVETSKCRGRPPCLPLEEGRQPSGEDQNASDAFEQAKKQAQIQAAQKLMGGWQRVQGAGNSPIKYPTSNIQYQSASPPSIIPIPIDIRDQRSGNRGQGTGISPIEDTISNIKNQILPPFSPNSPSQINGFPQNTPSAPASHKTDREVLAKRAQTLDTLKSISQSLWQLILHILISIAKEFSIQEQCSSNDTSSVLFKEPDYKKIMLNNLRQEEKEHPLLSAASKKYVSKACSNTENTSRLYRLACAFSFTSSPRGMINILIPLLLPNNPLSFSPACAKARSLLAEPLAMLDTAFHLYLDLIRHPFDIPDLHSIFKGDPFQQIQQIQKKILITYPPREKVPLSSTPMISHCPEYLSQWIQRLPAPERSQLLQRYPTCSTPVTEQRMDPQTLLPLLQSLVDHSLLPLLALTHTPLSETDPPEDLIQRYADLSNFYQRSPEATMFSIPSKHLSDLLQDRCKGVVDAPSSSSPFLLGLYLKEDPEWNEMTSDLHHLQGLLHKPSFSSSDGAPLLALIQSIRGRSLRWKGALSEAYQTLLKAISKEGLLDTQKNRCSASQGNACTCFLSYARLFRLKINALAGGEDTEVSAKTIEQTVLGDSLQKPYLSALNQTPPVSFSSYPLLDYLLPLLYFYPTADDLTSASWTPQNDNPSATPYLYFEYLLHTLACIPQYNLALDYMNSSLSPDFTTAFITVLPSLSNFIALDLYTDVCKMPPIQSCADPKTCFQSCSDPDLPTMIYVGKKELGPWTATQPQKGWAQTLYYYVLPRVLKGDFTIPVNTFSTQNPAGTLPNGNALVCTTLACPLGSIEASDCPSVTPVARCKGAPIQKTSITINPDLQVYHPSSMDAGTPPLLSDFDTANQNLIRTILTYLSKYNLKAETLFPSIDTPHEKTVLDFYKTVPTFDDDYNKISLDFSKDFQTLVQSVNSKAFDKIRTEFLEKLDQAVKEGKTFRYDYPFEKQGKDRAAYCQNFFK